MNAEQAQETASKYGGILSARPVCIFGFAFNRQGMLVPPHTRIPSGGIEGDHACSFLRDVARAKGGRWVLPLVMLCFLKLFLLFGGSEEFCKTLTFHVSRSQVLPSILLTGLSL